ncbi:MAG: selenocysteine-specific translation elongation factor [Actinobacteria bacterium]|nr:selenocysteine-specific translation elongation factor [Actinomycetota bacterium]
MRVVATAGHVDHGKSTLLRTLTGMEPDRWAEERARGLTIDLGFVWGALEPGGEVVAFVDVPGHERFVGNMLAGAGAVRLALFVVAADDGWSAQSQEHLDILDLLGVAGAVVAITKSGLAGEDRALEVAADVEERLTGTSLAGAPIVVTDALAGTGVDELRRVLAERLADVPAPPDERRARLWIDRSFTIAGAGTVVTGTLAGGGLAVGDDVALLPSGISARVRGLQSLGASVGTVRPGDRVAVNLSGVDRDDVGRGDALVTGGQPPASAWLVSDTLDTEVRALPGQVVDRPGAWHLHVGSAEVRCSVHPLLGEPVTADRPGYVRLVLATPLPVQTGDRFVLRDAGRRATVGGGRIVDPRPPGRVRGVDQRLGRTELLDAVRDADDPGGRLAALVGAWEDAAPLPDVRAAVGERPDAPLPDGVVRVAGVLTRTSALARWRSAVVTAARAHHEATPASPGAGRDELAGAAVGAGCPTVELARDAVDLLAGAGTLRRHGTAYALPEHAPAVDEALAERRERFLALLGGEPLSPPKLADAAKEAGLDPGETQRLVQAGEVVRAGDLAFLPAAVDDAVARLRQLQDQVGPFTAAQAKEAWATTRRAAIPLLELLDRRGVTTFDGQLRRLR